MSGISSPQSTPSVSDSPSLNPAPSPKVWSSDGQGPLMHWLLFELYTKYDPEELHRKLDGLIFRVLTLPSASVCMLPPVSFSGATDEPAPSDRDAIILLRREPAEGQYLLCVGREEPWQSVWPEDRIMTAIQNAALATARHLGTTVARNGAISSGLPIDDLLSEGQLWRKAQVQGHV